MIDCFHQYSDTPIQLFEYGSVRACHMVETKELDLALVNLDFYNIQAFNYHVLMDDSTIYCVSRNHRFASEQSVSIDMLRDEPVIFYNTDSVQNQTIRARFRTAGLTPRVLLHSSQLYTTLNFLRGGSCGAFLYASLAVNPRDFVKLPLHPEIITQFGLIWSRDMLQKRTQSFIDFAKTYDITPFI